jgi:sugar phosphate isomerase/epimerase
MYKNLNPDGLGITGRQSELIELALTYGFRGVDVDLAQFAKQVELRGLDHARRLLESAKLKIGGFELPMDWRGADDVFRRELAELPRLAELASNLGATGCFATVEPASDTLPYHENFEFHRRRFAEVCDALAPYKIRLGLAFLAPASHRAGRQFQFIASPDALLLLAKTIGVSNVGVIVDLWQWHVGGGTADQIRGLAPEQIVGVRVADLRGDANVEEVTEDDRLLPDGEGAIDVAGTLALLAERRYKGPVTPYPSPSQFAGMRRDAIVQRASASLDSFLKPAAAAPAGGGAKVPAGAGK